MVGAFFIIKYGMWFCSSENDVILLASENCFGHQKICFFYDKNVCAKENGFVTHKSDEIGLVSLCFVACVTYFVFDINNSYNYYYFWHNSTRSAQVAE